MSLDKKVIIKAKKALSYGGLGQNSSRFLGQGDDFADVYEYVAGEDIRYINSAASAKTGRLYVNRYNSQRDINIISVLLLDKNMNFGISKTKFECVLEIVAYLGLLATSNRDRYSCMVYEERLLPLGKATKKISNINHIIKELSTKREFRQKIDTTRLDSELARIKKGSIIFLLGDFFYPLNLSLCAKKHEVIPIVIRDRFEEEPFVLGESGFYSTDMREGLSCYFGKDELFLYKEEIKREKRELKRVFRKAGIEEINIYTSGDIYEEIRKRFRGKGWS